MVGGGLVLFVKLAATLVALATPLLGVWIASSLAAYSNLRTGLVVLSGLLLFPIGPLAWDVISELRRRGSTAPRFLTFGDRLILRTLVLNVVFLGALLALSPKTSFVALSTRGDWMLDGREGRAATWLRPRLLRAASALEWVYLAAHDNPYKDASAEKSRPEDTETSTSKGPGAPDPRDQAARDDAKAEARGPVRAWPFPPVLHPMLAEMPSAAEQSIEAVGRYVAEHEPDPFLRVKALHDWIADRIAYDYPAYQAYLRGVPIPAEDADAEAVFARKLGVCAGYSQLLVALGAVTGDEIVYVTGDTRGKASGIMGGPHAWNAAKIEGRWYLLDATWSRPVDEAEPEKHGYRPSYLFAPPEVFGLDHFPDDPSWQLRAAPISRSDFLRQPLLVPDFAALGLTLRSPDRSQITVSDAFELEIENPAGAELLVDVVPRGGSSEGQCSVDGGATLRVRCRAPNAGIHEARMFARAKASPAPSYDYVGQIEVVSRGP